MSHLRSAITVTRQDIIVGTTKTKACRVYDVVNIQRKKIVTDTTDTARNRRSGVSATINNIHQNAENINHESQKGKKIRSSERLYTHRCRLFDYPLKLHHTQTKPTGDQPQAMFGHTPLKIAPYSNLLSCFRQGERV